MKINSLPSRWVFSGLADTARKHARTHTYTHPYTLQGPLIRETRLRNRAAERDPTRLNVPKCLGRQLRDDASVNGTDEDFRLVKALLWRSRTAFTYLYCGTVANAARERTSVVSLWFLSIFPNFKSPNPQS